MALKIIWSENALSDYKQVVDYLLKEWPISIADEFVSNVESRKLFFLFFQTLVLAQKKLLE